MELFEDLQDNKIDAVLINESTKNLLDTDLADMNLKLKEIYKVYASIEFARERHSFKNGDIQRVKNQPKVLTAIIKKITS